MKVQVEVDVPAGMIVYDVGVGLIKCNRCCETAPIAYDAPDASTRMHKFMVQHVNSCVTKQPSAPSFPGTIHRRPGSREDAWLCANKPGADTECDQGFPK